jgi:hypothetical protein
MTFLFTIARAAGFFGVLAIIVLSLVPGTYRPQLVPSEAEHFIAYYSTAFAFALGFRSRASRVVIVLGLTLLAGSMEVLQLWVPGRHSAIIDAVVSRLGGLRNRTGRTRARSRPQGVSGRIRGSAHATSNFEQILATQVSPEAINRSTGSRRV